MPKLAEGHLSSEALDDLVRNFLDGNEFAFEDIYNDTYYSVYYTIYLLNKNHSQIEDLVQETYIRAYQHINQYTLGTNFRAWIVRMAHNLTINAYKKNDKEYAVSEIDDTKLKFTYSTWEREYEVEEVLKQLDEEEKKVFELIVLAGVSFKEASQILKVNLNRVYYLYRSMKNHIQEIKKGI